MTTPTTHVMLDLESLSTQHNAAIVQLSAIAFDPLTGLVDGTPEARPQFNVYIADKLSDAHIDVRTVAWWLQQKPASALGRAIENEGLHIGAALNLFIVWLRGLGPVEVIWSHGASFDLAVLKASFVMAGVEVPWNFRQERDTRTLYALAPGGMPFVPTSGKRKHDALYDCEIQIQQVVGALAALRTQRINAELYTEQYAVGGSRS